MYTLLLRIAAPMQSWGGESKYDTRDTQKEPTKSGILGLLAAAQGLSRADEQGLARLAKLQYAVRVEREGALLNDFHTAHSEKSSYITHRYYLCDAVFLCGLACEDCELLQQYANSLTHPVYPLFLGRRCCPPTLPLVLGVRQGDLLTVLRSEPPLISGTQPVRIITDAMWNDPAAVTVKDSPISYSPYQRQFGYRKMKEYILTQNRQTEHDPFAELEAAYVSDENGA